MPLDRTTLRALREVLADTPEPARGSDSAAPPRYRADFGPFLGVEFLQVGVMRQKAANAGAPDWSAVHSLLLRLLLVGRGYL